MSYLAFGTSNISLHRFTLGWAFHSLPKPPFSWFVRMTAQVQAIACASCQGLCRANKKAHEGAVAMKEDRQVAETNTIYNQRKKLYPKANNRDINWQTQWWPNKQPPNSQQSCKFCLQLHLRGAQNCPAWGETCLKCGKRNHFKGSTEYQGNVNNVNDQPDESELIGALFIGSVEQPTETNISWEVEMPATNGTINLKIDTGCHSRPSGRTDKTEHSFKWT